MAKYRVMAQKEKREREYLAGIAAVALRYTTEIIPQENHDGGGGYYHVFNFRHKSVTDIDNKYNYTLLNESIGNTLVFKRKNLCYTGLGFGRTDNDLNSAVQWFIASEIPISHPVIPKMSIAAVNALSDKMYSVTLEQMQEELYDDAE
ncbi:hypothetical protein AAF302_000713 [Pluralibacter gergoviae]